MHFTQAQAHNNNWVQLWAVFIDALHIKTSICARMLIPKDRLAVFTNYPKYNQGPGIRRNSFHLIPPCGSWLLSTRWCYYRGCNCPSQCHQRLTLKSRTGSWFSAHWINCNQPIPTHTHTRTHTHTHTMYPHYQMHSRQSHTVLMPSLSGFPWYHYYHILSNIPSQLS